MSAPISLGSMVTSVLRRANIEQQVVVGGFIQPAELREYLNEELAELWDLLMAARAQEHMRKSFSFSTVSGTSDYPLPADLEELLSVDLQETASGRKRSLKPYMEGERNLFSLQGATGFGAWHLTRYRTLGSPQMAGSSVTVRSINFQPIPNAAYVCTLNYYPTFPLFATDGSADNSVFEGVNGWEGFSIWGAVATCKAKLKEDGSFALGKKEQFRQRILELASENDAGAAERIQDTECRDDGFGHWSFE